MTSTLTGHDVEEGELPEGWGIRSLRDVATLSLGKMLDKKQQTGLHPTPYLRNVNVRWGRVASDDVQTMDISPDQIDRVSLRNGDVVVCEGGEPGRAAVWAEDETFAIQKALHRVRPVPELNPAYLYFVFEKEFRGVGDHPLFTGTTIKHLPKEKISLVRVPMPPLDEQVRIVEILEDQLSRLDTALQSVHTVREKAAQFRRSLLHAAFTGALTGHDVEEGELPEGWESRPLSAVCKKVVKVDPREFDRERFQYVDIGSIDTERNRVSTPQDVPVTEAPGRARQLLESGDTVFSTVRPYLRKIAWIHEDLDGEIASTGFCVLRPDVSLCLPRFLHFIAISDCLLAQVLPLQRGVSYPAVRDKEVLAADVPIPPLPEQGRIVEILEDQLSRLDASLAVADAVEERSAALRRSLLHSAFTGRLTSGWREAVNV